MASSRLTAPNLWQGGSPTSKSCFASPQKNLTVGRQPVPVSPRGQLLAPAPGFQEDRCQPCLMLSFAFGLTNCLYCPSQSHAKLKAYLSQRDSRSLCYNLSLIHI